MHFKRLRGKFSFSLPDIHGRYTTLFLKKDVAFFALMGNIIFFSLKVYSRQEKQTLAYDWTKSKFLKHYSWMKKHYNDVHDLLTVQRPRPSVWSASIEQVFLWKHWLRIQFYDCIRSSQNFHNPLTPTSLTCTHTFIHSISLPVSLSS